MESANCRRRRLRVLGRGSASALAACLVLLACPPTPAPSSGAIPDPVVSADPAQQKLDTGLVPAYKSMKAGQWSDARDKVAAYVRQKGALARGGQAEFVIAMTYHRQQLYGEASEHFARALAAEPGFLETYYYAGSALFNLGRLTEARAVLAVFAKHNGEDASTAFQQGLVELEDDRVDDAERFLRRAIAIAEKKKEEAKDSRALDEDLGRYYARLGDVHVRRDDFPRAKETFTKATELRADIPDIWHKLERACERVGDSAGAARARRVWEQLNAERASGATRPK